MNSKRSGKRLRRSRACHRNNLALPARAEWDFSNCPDEELFSCSIYEFKREIPEVIKSVEKWRRQSATRTFESFRALPGRPSVCSPISTFHCFPEWPSQPYLSIDPAERNSRYKSFHPKTHNQYVADALKPDLPATFDWYSLMEVLRDPGFVAPPIAGLPESALLALLQIDLEFTDETLVEQFRSLLRIYRQSLEIQGEPRPKGKASPIRALKANLRVLGAYRLREKYKMPAAEVIRHTTKVSGRPIYSDEAHLRRAVKNATKLIKSAQTELIERSRRTLALKRFLFSGKTSAA